MSLNAFCVSSKTTTTRLDVGKAKRESDNKSGAVFFSSLLLSSSSIRTSFSKSQRGSLRTHHRRFSNSNALRKKTNEGLLSTKARTVMLSSSSNEREEMKDVQITLVDCFVLNNETDSSNKNNREKMKSETRKNAQESIMELENARFDALRTKDQFVLMEIFKGKEAISEHKNEPHYKNWNKNVESLMSKPRAKRSYKPVFPTNEDWNRVNTPLQIDENGQQIEVLEGSGNAVACHVTITVRKKDCAMFEKISIENAISSKLEEDGGCLRFDIFKRIFSEEDENENDAEEYLFAEVFRDPQAQKFHAQTAHSQNWKTKVEPMMAKARTWIQFDEVVFPIDDKMWADGDACEEACEMAW